MLQRCENPEVICSVGVGVEDHRHAAGRFRSFIKARMLSF